MNLTSPFSFPSIFSTALAGENNTFQDGFPLSRRCQDGLPHVHPDRGVALRPHAQVLRSCLAEDDASGGELLRPEGCGWKPWGR